MLEVEQRRQRAHALAHVLVVAGDLLHLVEEFFGKKVRIRIDPHLRSSGFSLSSCPARSQACADCVNFSALPGISVFFPCYGKDVDGMGTRACPSSALLSAASRVNPTCGDKPGHDGLD